MTVLRDGREVDLPHDELVPGDVVVLAAGAAVPADCRILLSTDLFVDESTLTGESYPAEKGVGDLSADTPLAKRSNALFQGSHVVSGTCRAVVVQTGAHTVFGEIAERLRLRPPETDFERGLRRCGELLIRITMLLVIAIFGINVFLERPVVDSFLFALALAVGLSPELLPAIVSLTLARGSQQMAASRVIVRRLNSIEDFGIMNVLRNLVFSREYTLLDRINFFRGVFKSVDALYPELSRIDLFVQAPEVKIPIYFCLGRHDYEVPSILSAQYFEALRAPRKQLVRFERSAHLPTRRRRTSSMSS